MSAVAEPSKTPLKPLAPARSIIRHVDSGLSLPGENRLQLAVEVRWPDRTQFPQPSIALVCLPGGGMNRRFFDLIPADGGTDFSFAEQMRARGFIVILVDHLGVGDSSRPRDVFSLTPEVLTQTNQHAVEYIVSALRDGSLTSELPALTNLRTIGVGHSMGALLTLVQQHEFHPHAAVAVLGFSTGGLPQYVSEEALGLMAADAVGIRKELERLARAQFGDAPSVRRSSPQSGDLFAAAKADPRGIAALKPALAPMLPVPAFLSMLPGNIAAECAAIDVPVFIGVGELDMTGPAQLIPAAFSTSRDVTLEVLPQAGHSHFIFPARAQLFDRLAEWAAARMH